MISTVVVCLGRTDAKPGRHTGLGLGSVRRPTKSLALPREGDHYLGLCCQKVNVEVVFVYLTGRPVVAVSAESWSPPAVLVAVDLVILTLRTSRLHVLLVERGIEPYLGDQALPGGFLNNADEDIVAAAHRELREEANLDASRLHLEQLGAYGAPGRDPRGRIISVAYLAIAPGLPEPVAGTDAAGASWKPVEAVLSGHLNLAFDHQRIVIDGVERARKKLEHSPLAAAFCGETFTVSELQQVYEAVWGVQLDPRNFYRKVQGVPGFIIPSGSDRRTTGGRPARLFHLGPRTVLYPPIVRPDPSMTNEGLDDRETGSDTHRLES